VRGVPSFKGFRDLIHDFIGGYRFCPQTSLSDALSIFVRGIFAFIGYLFRSCQDLETMLSSAERIPRPPKPPVRHDIALRRYGNTLDFPVDIVTISEFPHRAPHVKLQESVKPVAKLISASPTHDGRTKRIMREVGRCFSTASVSLMFSPQLKTLTADPHPQVDLYVNDSDISFLKIILEVGVVISGVNMTDSCCQGTERRNQVPVSQWDVPSHM
jgi:hypothetical protein